MKAQHTTFLTRIKSLGKEDYPIKNLRERKIVLMPYNADKHWSLFVLFIYEESSINNFIIHVDSFNVSASGFKSGIYCDLTDWYNRTFEEGVHRKVENLIFFQNSGELTLRIDLITKTLHTTIKPH